MSPTRISVLVPVRDEAESVRPLLAELVPVLEGIGRPWEILFIDDGSTDGTRDILRDATEEIPGVRMIRFTRNFGKAAAYMAGFRHAGGRIIVTMDGDLQDDPGEIPEMLRELEEGDNDLVVGWKKERLANEPVKKIPSVVYNRIKSLLFGLSLHDSNSGYRVMRRPVMESLDLYGGNYRFIPELAALRGYRVAEVPVHHRARQFGQSKFGPFRFWTGLLDLLTVRFLTGFIARPLHFFGTAGLIPLLLGGLLEFYVLAARLMGSTFRTHLAAMIIGVLLIVVGVQLIATGLVCEMLSAQGQRRSYEIAGRFGFQDND